MIKCKVFSSCWERANGETHWGPERAFNKFCKENSNIEVIKIDTLINNGYPQIFLYYKEPETTYSCCSGNHMLSDFEYSAVRNFKPGDKVIYKTNCKEYTAEIIKTENFKCIIKINATGDFIETNYRYLEKVDN